jgi:chromosome segregation protein
MKDVIFAGCDTRGKSKFAEVSLEFDNSKGYIKNYAGDVLKVARRAEADGRSAYYINDELARLKDIQDIFLDTGIGNDSYSMIGQEQTKKLLSSKIEDRRAIFEEAAGIVRLKNQKETTEKSLVEIELNFVRLSDILKELEKQLKPLKKQKEKADLYVELSTKLKNIEVDFISKKVQMLTEEFISLSQENNQLISLLKSHEEEILVIDVKIQGLKLSNKEQNEQLFSLQEQKSKLEQETLIIEKQVESYEDRNRQFSQQLKTINADIEEIQAKHNISFTEIQKKKNRLSYLENSIKNLSSDLEKKENDIFINEQDARITKEKVEKTRKEVAELFNTYNESKLNFEQQRLTEEKILKEISLIQTDSTVSIVSKLKEELEQIELELKDSERKFSEIQQNLLTFRTKKEKLTEEIHQLDNLKFQNENEKKTKTILLNQLENSNENKDFLFFSVKKIIEHQNQFPGIIDIVSNLLKPKKGFEISVDSLLSNMSQFFVLEDFKYAKEVIQFLKKNNFGSASFLSLNDAKPKRFSENELSVIRKQDGIFYTPDHIEYDKKYEPIILQIFGRTLISDNLDTAIKFSKSTSFSFKVSTQEGEIVQPGVVSGGSKSKKGAFALQKEIDTLLIEIKDIEKRTIELINFKELKLEETTKNNESLSLFQIDLTSVEKSKNELSLLVERRKTELLNAQENSKEKSLKLSELQQELNQVKNVSSKNYDFYHNKKNEFEKNEKHLENLITSQDAMADSLIQQKDDFHSSNNLLSTQQEELKNLSAFLEEYKNGSDDFERKLISLEEKKKVIEEEFEHNDIEMDKLFIELKIKKDALSEVIITLDESKNNFKTDTSELEGLEKTFSELSKNKEVSTKRQYELNLSINDLSNQLLSLTKRANDAYELNREDLLNRAVDEIDLVKCEKEISYLREEIKKIGSVNIESIKDFTELDARFQKENSQYQDVKNAKDDLETLLKSVRDEMKERFVDTFKQIATYFEETFIDLFGGGRAKLSLDDPRNPLTSHIKIMAQPPGKKPNSIESLSGGEKAMTVSALIFAIIKTKPSPFVYLDEIDAPLDDANVSRFAFYLKKSSENSQFIVVTHRKGTMMAADSLFGVTQEEPGITIVFPHKLENIHKEA